MKSIYFTAVCLGDYWWLNRVWLIYAFHFDCTQFYIWLRENHWASFFSALCGCNGLYFSHCICGIPSKFRALLHICLSLSLFICVFVCASVAGNRGSQYKWPWGQDSWAFHFYGCCLGEAGASSSCTFKLMLTIRLIVKGTHVLAWIVNSWKNIGSWEHSTANIYNGIV